MLKADYSRSHGEFWSCGGSSGVSQLEAKELSLCTPHVNQSLGVALTLGVVLSFGPREFPETMAA